MSDMTISGWIEHREMTGFPTFSYQEVCDAFAELTAIDLVQYAHLAGGLSAVATVIAELVEKTDFNKQGDELVKATTYPTLQRLGYILDEVLDEQEQASAIEQLLQPYYKELKYRPLSGDHPTDQAERNKRWKLVINQEIEPDEW
jgi:hypothetical protein